MPSNSAQLLPKAATSKQSSRSALDLTTRSLDGLVRSLQEAGYHVPLSCLQAVREHVSPATLWEPAGCLHAEGERTSAAWIDHGSGKAIYVAIEGNTAILTLYDSKENLYAARPDFTTLHLDLRRVVSGATDVEATQTADNVANFAVGLRFLKRPPPVSRILSCGVWPKGVTTRRSVRLFARSWLAR